MDLTKSSAEDLKALHVEAAARFDVLRGRNLSLDITRGKPSADQLSLSDDLLTIVKPGDTNDENGTDLRN